MAEIKAPTGTGCSSRVFCSQNRVKATSCPAWPCLSLTVPQQLFRFSVQLLNRLQGWTRVPRAGRGLAALPLAAVPGCSCCSCPQQ